jgi:hypothetical protein
MLWHAVFARQRLVVCCITNIHYISIQRQQLRSALLTDWGSPNLAHISDAYDRNIYTSAPSGTGIYRKLVYNSWTNVFLQVISAWSASRSKITEPSSCSLVTQSRASLHANGCLPYDWQANRGRARPRHTHGALRRLETSHILPQSNE